MNLSPYPRKIFSVLVFSFFLTGISYCQDIPGNSPDIQTLPVGSLVIPMDNTLQQNSSGIFNLKTYGFIVTLLNQSYGVKWVIKTGKTKDEADFSALAEKVLPVSSAPALYDFKGGPFVIFAADTGAVIAHLNNYNATLAASEQVSIYRLTEAVSADIRYNLYKIPRIAILNDGNNTAIHTAYMTAAGIPSSNYSIRSAIGLSNDCVTFASEPHIDATGPWVDSIKSYVQNGGNFLAQCHAIEIYENSTGGHFHVNTSITTVNRTTYPSVTYPNADMAYAQFTGAFNPNKNGSVKNWEKTVGGTFINNHYSVIGSSTYPDMIGASVSKLVGGEGGLVFYLGNHEFDDLTNQEVVNGIRMYMNAMLMPSALYCNYIVWGVLPVTIEYFQAYKKANNTAELKWGISQEEKGTVYIIERSNDGKNYTTIDAVGAAGSDTYSWIDENPFPAINFYRLRIETVNGKINYSNTARVSMDKDLAQFNIFPNPANLYTDIQTGLSLNEQVQIKIVDMTGRTVYSQRNTLQPMMRLNTASLPSGLYWTLVTRANGAVIKNKLVINH